MKFIYTIILIILSICIWNVSSELYKMDKNHDAFEYNIWLSVFSTILIIIIFIILI